MIRKNYVRRIALLKNEIKRHDLDAILISKEINVSYLSGFAGHDSLVLITPDKNYFITDSRYSEEAGNTVRDFEIILPEHSIFDTLLEIMVSKRLRRVGFEAMDLPYSVAARFIKNDKKIKFNPCSDFVERIRLIKDADEIQLIKNAARLTKNIFKDITGLIRPGISEKQIEYKIESIFLKNRARPAFESIIAAGAHASMPHAKPTDALIKNNSFVMVDIGAKLNYYCADMTRMVIIGRPGDRFKEIYNIVKIAQEKAINLIRPGVLARDIDAAARNHISSAGFGKNFAHSVGHGVGLDIHEKPTISYANDKPIEAGMVFTVEPAIYIKKFGGVRIEDLVLVTKNGCEILTQ